MAGAWKDVRFGDRPGEVVNRCLRGGELVVLGWGGRRLRAARKHNKLPQVTIF